MVSAKGLELGQESRVKLGLLLWSQVQLSPSFTTSPSCSSLPGNRTQLTRVLFWGPECCVSISQGLGGGG